VRHTTWNPCFPCHHSSFSNCSFARSAPLPALGQPLLVVASTRCHISTLEKLEPVPHQHGSSGLGS
jgi:hypothetical protein